MKEGKDFEKWFKTKVRINNRNLKPLEAIEGEVWWSYLGANIGTEIDGKSESFTRPVLILKAIDETLFLVAPLTTSKFYNDVWHPVLDYNFKKSEDKVKKSKICLNQIKVIDYKRLKIKICDIDNVEFKRIKDLFFELYKTAPAQQIAGQGTEYLRSDASATIAGAFDISISDDKEKSRHDFNVEALVMHAEHHGKISLSNKVPLATREDLSRAYTPGVAAVCMAIANAKDNHFAARKYTLKRNTVAIVSDGSAVLGLGNIGPYGAIPVMEGKAAILKEFADVDAFPICLDTTDVEEIIKAVKQIAPVFGGINLEDISAPRCFEIEERLRKELNIPMMHDDQWGTATVVLAGLINSIKLRNIEKEKNNNKADTLSEIKIIINGVGSAGVAVARLLIAYGFTNILFVDSKGLIHRGRDDLNKEKLELLTKSTAVHLSDPLPYKEGGVDGGGKAITLSDTMRSRDVFIGLSKPGMVTAEMVRSMNKRPIIFSLANPTPEIMPEDAHAVGAFIVATGRSDYPNQLNNSLIFPGLWKGMLDNDIRQFDIDIFMRAALALAEYVQHPTVDAILPSMFDKGLVNIISQSVIKK